MDAMPRPRPPYLLREKTRHGRVVWYFRRDDGPRIRIRGEYGSPEFMAAYQAAERGQPAPARGGPTYGTLAWLIDRFRDSAQWRSCSPTTRQIRDAVFTRLIEAAGDEPCTTITEAAIIAGRDRRPPATGRQFVAALRVLFGWAKSAQLVKINPAAGVAYPRLGKNSGFPVWTEEDVAAYEARWPIGTKERVWLAVLLYTGLRRGDAVRLGRQHVRDGVATLRTEKSQGEVEVTIPLLPPLIEALRAGPTGDLAFICGATGKPLDKRTFGAVFRIACNAAGVRKSAHGVRKAGATRAANNGATVAQLEAIFGWSGGKMASYYTKTADRRRLARDGMNKLWNESGKSIPAPASKVRGSDGKE